MSLPILKNPEYLWLLLTFLFLLFFYFLVIAKKKNTQSHSSLLIFKSLQPTWKEKIKHAPLLLRMIALFLIILALTRPQQKIGQAFNNKEGIDIMFILDISVSMNIQDFLPNRLEVAKKEMVDFIEKRPNDRLGLVIFGKDAFLQSPLTFEKELLKSFVNRVDFLDEVKNETAIGVAVATGVIALKDSKSTSKIIILLTDGNNNAGEIDPITAANVAKEYGIKVYPISIGNPGKSVVKQTVRDPFLGERVHFLEVFMDESTLKRMAEITSGKYFNVKNSETFSSIYKEINQLEKSEIKEAKFNVYQDYFPWIVQLILISVFLELIFTHILLKRRPF